ncbi:MAG TPA: Gfo/Idh/MocA family oxidoreductase [Candidatus Pelethocola excrementipullorum]|nr:Gfo/Idh/MocA family oxidoreductase [Candidatus Pelethocola excrementipullorum]
MKKLRMAIIGSGQIARVTHIPNYQKMEDVEIVAVCDTNLSAARSLAEQFEIPEYFESHIEMLEAMKPDAVTICVPNKFHCQITLDALERGCHVLCEKPPAITAGEAELMEKTAAGKNLLLSYEFHFRHSEQAALLKEKITNGEFGKIYNSRALWHRRRGIPGWGNFTNKNVQGGGPLIDIGVHMLDLGLYLLDYPKISYICASSSDRIGKRGGVGLMGSWESERFTVEDGLFGYIYFEDGTSMSLETSFAVNMKERDMRNIVLYGELLGASVFPLELYGEEKGHLSNQSFPFTEIGDWHFVSEKNFVDACLGREELLVTAKQGTYVQKVICSLYESAESGKPVIL